MQTRFRLPKSTFRQMLRLCDRGRNSLIAVLSWGVGEISICQGSAIKPNIHRGKAQVFMCQYEDLAAIDHTARSDRTEPAPRLSAHPPTGRNPPTSRDTSAMLPSQISSSTGGAWLMKWMGL